MSATAQVRYLDGLPVERVGPSPPSFEELRGLLWPFCLNHPELVRLEVFGSVAADQAIPGSDVDLLATFERRLLPRGLAYFGYQETLQNKFAALLGVPADLHDRANVELDRNVQRREGILSSARLIYSVRDHSSPPHGS